MPFFQVAHRVLVHVALEAALPVARLPDHALKRLERRDLSVLVYPADETGDYLVVGRTPTDLPAGVVQQPAHGRVAGVRAHEVRDVAADRKSTRLNTSHMSIPDALL